MPGPMAGNDGTDQSPMRLIEVVLDEASITQATPDIEREQRVAVFDLLENNFFKLESHPDAGPYNLKLAIADNRLVLEISGENGDHLTTFILSLSRFQKIVRDYFLVCGSYFEAIKTAPPSQIEALDMGRRGLHNEGSQLVMERLDGKIEVDFDTARRLFTLISALLWKG